MIRFILILIYYFNNKHNHLSKNDYVYDKMIIIKYNMNEGECIMISFENNKLNNLALPMSIVRMLTLGVIIKAYKELEDRVGCIENTKGSKSERIEMAIEGKLGYFTKNEIRTICPDVGEATINRVFERMRVEGKIEVVGKGRNAKWKKL